MVQLTKFVHYTSLIEYVTYDEWKKEYTNNNNNNIKEG